MNRMLGALGTLLVSACVGCTFTPCDPATDLPSCDGSVRWSCPKPGVDQRVANRWVKVDCAKQGQVCVTPSGGSSICALSAGPDPGCSSGALATCESPTSLLACDQGLATARRSCRACLADAEGVVRCEGGLGAGCTTSADCGPSLGCDAGRCRSTGAP